MNSREWKELRLRKVQANPFCELCKEEGYAEPTRAIHHIVPIESGRTEAECRSLAFRWSNLISVCFRHHSKLHMAERSYSKEKIKERTSQRIAAWADHLINKFTKKT